MFSHLLNDEVPDFHTDMVDTIMEGGLVAFGAPRGGAKSTIVGLIYLAWVALNGKRHFVPYISDTYLQTKMITSGLRSELEGNEMVKFIYPNAINPGLKWGEEGFEIEGIEGKCYILPLGAGMKIRGLKYDNHRPDLVIIDDLENLEAVYSAEQRKKLQNWLDYDLLPALDRYSRNIIMIGTILHYHSLLRKILLKEDKYRGWKTKIFKALTDQGQSFWPARFPPDYLKAIRDDSNHPDYVGSIVFAQEMQNEPQDDKDRIIKIDWVKKYNFMAKIRGYQGETDDDRVRAFLSTLDIFGGVDPAISETQTADFFSYYTFGLDRETGKEYMLDLVHDKIGDIGDQVKLICDGIEYWGHKVVAIEAVQYQKGLATLVQKELQARSLWHVRIIPIRTDTDKVRRARMHSVAFEAGHIQLREDHKNITILQGQLEEFPMGAHDDAFDSLMLAREAREVPVPRVFRRKAF